MTDKLNNKLVVTPQPMHRIGINHMLSARNIKRIREDVLVQYRLTSPEWFILGIIGEEASVTAKDLAKELHANPTYITATLSKLKHKKMIVSKILSSDNRSRTLELTPEGKKITDSVSREVAQAINASFGHLNNEAVNHYFAITKALSECPENK